MASDRYHEAHDSLSRETHQLHQAIASLMEELEAVDWYQQRIDASTNDELKLILAHNRDEEKEHAAMLLEWLRRRDPCFEEQLKSYLFSTGDVAEQEEAETGTAGAGAESLRIGSLRKPGE
ncbi:MAG: ferritin-like domain-containing protein [Halieaceae bacterium]|jgi:ferritin-like protein|nr:ferritin-like domain-containing protein [Halieaceae bacterium]